MHRFVRAALLGALVAVGSAAWADVPTLEQRLDAAIAHAANTLRATATSGMPTDRYPVTAPAGGAWAEESAGYWVSGLFPGALWRIGDLTGDGSFHDYAQAWSAAIGPATQNIGFTSWPSHKLWFDHTGDAAARQIVIQAAEMRESVFVPLPDSAGQNVGSRGLFTDPAGWDPNGWEFPARDWAGQPIDHMMDLQVMFWAAGETGDGAMYDKSVLHARTVADLWVRADGSSGHWGYVNRTTGQFVTRQYQGYQDHTTWARGHSWAIYSLTLTARQTELAGDDATSADFLADAMRAADFWLGHQRLPADGVPIWDFDAPLYLPPEFQQRDSSAAAVMASALVDLSALAERPEDKYRYQQAAGRILESLATPKTEGGYLNVDAWGDPDGSGVLAHGVYVHSYSAATGNSGEVSKWVEMDHATIWGDYFFLEAVQRYLGALKLSRPGDANEDEAVNGGDYTIWADNFDFEPAVPWSDGGWAVGNFNEDSLVDGGDYTIWSDNYGSTGLAAGGAGTGGASIPEPVTAALLSLAAAALTYPRRRR